MLFVSLLRGSIRRILVKVAALRGNSRTGCNMEVKLFATFMEQLAIYRGFRIFNSEALGRDAAESMVVDITTTLCASPTSKVELPHVGTLLREKKEISFKPGGEWGENRTSALEKFFLDRVKQSNLWDNLTWAKVFQKKELFSGLDLIGRAASYYLQFQNLESPEKDRDLQDSLVEVACWAVHDAICCGAGIELETVGIFYQDLTFKPDELLIASIHSARPNSSGHIEPVKWLSVGPRPELDKPD
jgi:hypothetical protein